MPKEYFDFKQFRVFQDKCAMKVCTDSCLFGAIIEIKNKQNILDIGTGTGLLSLMVAQKANENALITAIEIDKDAASQAIENVKNSFWKSKISVLNQSIQAFCKPENKNKFDLIFTNPPFFQNNLKSPDEQSNLARHNTSLSFKELFDCVNHLLTTDGVFYILLPPAELQQFLKLTQPIFVETERINVKSNESSSIFRNISILKRNKEHYLRTEREIYIYEKNQMYSSDFEEILKPYYTIF